MRAAISRRNLTRTARATGIRAKGHWLEWRVVGRASSAYVFGAVARDRLYQPEAPASAWFSAQGDALAGASGW